MWDDSKIVGRPRPESNTGKQCYCVFLQFFAEILIHSMTNEDFPAFSLLVKLRKEIFTFWYYFHILVPRNTYAVLF